MTAIEAAPAALDLVEVGCAEAGAALLGAALAGDLRAADAVRDLDDMTLTDTRHRFVLTTMRALLVRGIPLDPVTVLGEMRANGTAARLPAGRDAGVYLADLLEQGVARDPWHCRRVVLEHTVRRVAREAGLRIQQAAGSVPLAELPAFVEQEAGRVIAAAEQAAATR